MQHINPIEIENKLALKMLKIAAVDNNVKNILKEIASVLVANVLLPINQMINKLNCISELPEMHCRLLENLFREHTQEMRQYGALFREVAKSADIVNSLQTLRNAMQGIKEALDKIDHI